MTIAESNDARKIFLYILIFDIRLPNIVQVMIFTKLIRKKLPKELQGKGIIDNITNK